MIDNAHREITRLIPEDRFLVEERIKGDFDFHPKNQAG